MIAVRNFKKSDLPAVVEIIRKTMGDKDAEYASKDIVAKVGYISRYGHACTYTKRFVVVLDGKVVGICGLYSNTPHPKGYYGIGWFAVDLAYQHHGAGRKLLESAEKRAKRLKAKVLFVWAEKSAVKFYEDHGFVVSKETLVPAESDVLMEKRF